MSKESVGVAQIRYAAVEEALQNLTYLAAVFLQGAAEAGMTVPLSMLEATMNLKAGIAEAQAVLARPS